MSITLYYPNTGTPSSSIILPNPEHGNSEQYDTNIAYHIQMDGTVASYKKKLKQVLLLNFSGVTKAKSDEFVVFYLANAGNELGYTDTLDRDWKIRMINNPLETTTTRGLGSCELKSFSIQANATGGISDTPDNALVDNVGNVLVDGDGNVLVYA